MSKIIALKIDVTKINKERLFKGEKGTYLDAVLFLNDDADQYGQHGMITQSVSKEERQSGIKGAILGNCKIIGTGNANSATGQPSQAAKPQTSAFNPDDDDLPF